MKLVSSLALMTFLLVGMAACGSLLVGTVQRDGIECLPVTLADLNNNPNMFAGESVCLDGFLAWGGEHWLLAGGGPDNSELAIRTINLGIPYDESFQPEWIEGDRIHARGVLRVAVDCLGPTSGEERSVWTPPDQCIGAVTPFSLTSTDARVTPLPDEIGECQTISFEQFAAAPLTYAYQPICLEALLQIEFEGMGLFPLSGIDNTRRILLAPSIGYLEAARQGFRTGDRVAVSGYVLLTETCQTPGTFCMGGSDFYFRSGSIEFVSREAPLDQCVETALPDLSLNIEDFANQIVCTNAQIEFAYSDIYLRPADRDGAVDLPGRPIYLWPFHPIVRSGDLRSGDRIAVQGRLNVPDQCYDAASVDPSTDESISEHICPDPPEPAYLVVDQLEVLNRAANHTTCSQVTIASLYSQPLTYAEDIVCTTGILHISVEPHGPPIIALTPDGYEHTQFAAVILELYLSPGELDARALTNGDRITVRGRFGLMEDCWRSFEAGEGCIGTKAPLWIAGVDVQEVR